MHHNQHKNKTSWLSKRELKLEVKSKQKNKSWASKTSLNPAGENPQAELPLKTKWIRLSRWTLASYQRTSVWTKAQQPTPKKERGQAQPGLKPNSSQLPNNRATQCPTQARSNSRSTSSSLEAEATHQATITLWARISSLHQSRHLTVTWATPAIKISLTWGQLPTSKLDQARVETFLSTRQHRSLQVRRRHHSHRCTHKPSRGQDLLLNSSISTPRWHREVDATKWAQFDRANSQQPAAHTRLRPKTLLV